MMKKLLLLLLLVLPKLTEGAITCTKMGPGTYGETPPQSSIPGTCTAVEQSTGADLYTSQGWLGLGPGTDTDVCSNQHTCGNSTGAVAKSTELCNCSGAGFNPQNPCNCLDDMGGGGPGSCTNFDGPCSAVAWDSQYIIFKNFQFGIFIPSNATIFGISLWFARGTNGTAGTIHDKKVQLRHSTGQLTVQSQEGLFGDWCPAGGLGGIVCERVGPYGGPNQLWNETWTADDINSPEFGFALRVHGDTHQSGAYALLQCPEMEVCWEVLPPTSTPTITQTPTPTETPLPTLTPTPTMKLRCVTFTPPPTSVPTPGIVPKGRPYFFE